MDTARQILRFSIPGSILLLHAIGCYFIYRRCQGVTFTDASTALKENIGALVAILATVPIGFVVYQAYYFTYAPVVRFGPLKWNGRFVRADRGWRILSTLDESQLEALSAIFDADIDVTKPYEEVPDPGHLYRHPLRKIQHWLRMLELNDAYMKAHPVKDKLEEEYESRWYANWDVLRSILDISGTIPGSSQIKTEYTTLLDIYHALGAARTAIVGGWTLVTVLAITHLGRIDHDLWQSLAGWVAISTVTALLYLILHRARRRTWKSASSSMRLGLRWLFYRYSHQFGPSEERKDENKGAEALSRQLAGESIDEAGGAMSESWIRDALRPRMRKAYDRTREMVAEGVPWKDGDGDGDAEEEEEEREVWEQQEEEAAKAGRRLPPLVALFASVSLVAVFWLLASPPWIAGLGISAAICATVALLVWLAAGRRRHSG